ncbi:hypothetical protein, partial [Lactiplantibacillus pentosus]|uniref:hypothetical protein n=1 Tax=Lactiplantibacillus pentosus TaxID=1589 RepID=UPI0021A82A94
LPGLEEDSYLKLRSGFLREFKSMSALFQRCQSALEVGLGRRFAASLRQLASFPAVLSWLLLNLRTVVFQSA